jgi:hypothetical protein
VRISDPGEIAAGLPQLLGFRPVESVVLISLKGPSGGRFGLTIRADIPTVEHERALAGWLAQSIGTDHPAGVLIAVVSEAADDRGLDGDRELPHRSLVHELTMALAAVDLPVRDAMLVRAGRWWSFDCPHPCCDPAAGTPLPDGVSELEVASVAAGVVVAGSRDELESRIAPLQGLPRAAMENAVLRTGAELDVRARAFGPGELEDEGWALVRAAVARFRRTASEPPADDDLARVLWALSDIPVRDRAMQLAVGEDADAAEALWTDCTRRAPAPLDAAPATLLAVSAWLRGDGAMANVALDRALDSDPGYRLARLLRQALSRCLPPGELRALLAAGGADDAAWLRS